MPLYNIEHSFPLTLQQKTDLAERITKLHGITFTTLSVFVQVKYYQQDASTPNHFVGGKLLVTASNRITAYVRSSPSRKQEQLDKLAEEIENAWYVVLGERDDEGDEDRKDKKKDKKEETSSQRAAKELLSIVFIGGLSGREKGFPIPVAGEETSWFKQYHKDFESRGELGDESLKDLLEEVETRDDLKSWKN